MMRRDGATLVELIVTMSVVAIIAAATAGIVVYLMQLFIYLPRQMRARDAAHEVIEAMIEGEASKRGMRYAMRVQDASSTQFTCTFGYPANTDKRNMRFRFYGNKIYRSYTAFGDPVNGPQPPYGQEEIIPYYAAGDISISGETSNPNVIFTYFTASGSQLADPVPPAQLNTIRRVEIGIVVNTGTGLFQNWDGSFATTSGVDIKEYI